MVYITAADGVEKKYACMKCIKGHRSSKCTHRERELFEIKRKGRPVSQCENCRYLRKTKQVHIKCMCHVNKDKDQESNIPVIDQGFRYAELPSPNAPTTSTTSTSCNQCDRPKLYCICQNNQDIKLETIVDTEVQPVYHSSVETLASHTTTSSFSSAGLNIHNQPSNPTHIDVTTPSSTATPMSSVPASPSGTASPITNKPFNRHLTIPIHDPSDDIDSDTPIYKSVEDNDDDKPALGEFTSKSSDELMNQIYSGFDPANSSASSPLLREDDDQLIEIFKDP